jgi:valyl-tRNA synthetase
MHALVRDASGQKMSKSKGNVMDPLDLIDKYGADAVRFTLTAMAAQGRDIRLSEERIEGYRNFSTKLWNASRYCEMNECFAAPDFDPASVAYTPNKWIIGEVLTAKADIDAALAGYKFNEAAHAIYQFVRGTFCDWYLEFTKPLLEEESEHSAEIRNTTGWVLDQILILLNPFMPFITEELNESRARGGEERSLLMQQAWPSYDEALADPEAAQKMDWLTRMISEIRSVRADMNVPAGAKIKLLVKDACDSTRAGLEAYEEILKRMARLESIDLTQDVPKGSIQTIVDKTTLILPIADIIDLDKERARLQKEIEKIDVEVKKIEGKLSNEKFVANAPDEIVEEQHSRKAEFIDTREKLSQALKQLEAA